MPYGSVDPSTLKGNDLIRWYRRTPWEIEQERQAARLQQYNDFFGVNPGGDSDGEAADDEASNDASGGDQTASPSGFPAPSFGPAGYVPGLLGDTRQMVSQSSPQHGGILSIDAPSPADDIRQGPAPAQTPSTAGPDTQTPAAGGAALDRGLWPKKGDPNLTLVSAPSPVQSRASTPPPPPNNSPLPLSPQLRPSNGFISWMFGGPVPLRDSTGRITGYYDHQAANAGLKITGA